MTDLDLTGWKLSKGRRAAAALKMAVYHDGFKGIVENTIRERIEDAKTARLVCRYASTTTNLARTVVDTVAMGYSRGCRRTLRGASPDVAKAFADLIVEAAYDRRCARLAHYAWWLGPCFVLPSVSKLTARLGLDIVTPDRSDAERTGPEELRSVLWQRQDDGVFVRVDAAAWAYFDREGKPIAGESTVPHALGRVPAAIFRSESWEKDWWLQAEHGGLLDATIAVAFKFAVMEWSRYVQANKLMTIVGAVENIPAGQSISHPSQPFYAKGDASKISIGMLDRTVPIADYLAEIAAIIKAAVTRYGIPSSEITFAQNVEDWGALSLSVRKEKLGNLRDLQVPWLRSGERDLWPTVVDTVRASQTHRSWKVLPPGDEVRDMLELDFPDFVDTDEALKRHELFEKRLRHGLENPINLLIEQRPELTQAEAEAIVLENLKKWSEHIEISVTRNTSTDPAKGAQTIAQMHGAVGGQTRAQNQQEQPQ